MSTHPEPVLPHFAEWQQQTTSRPNAQLAFYQANRDLTAQPLHTPRPIAANLPTEPEDTAP